MGTETNIRGRPENGSEGEQTAHSQDTAFSEVAPCCRILRVIIAENNYVVLLRVIRGGSREVSRPQG